MTGYHETNFSMAYSSHISWQTPDSPVPVEVYPSLAFDNLFDNRGSLRNLSILDRVKDRAEALSRKISASDKAKLDEYLTSVREVEKRVDGMRKTKDQADDAAKQREPSRLHDGAPGQRPARRPARARAPDVRHHRHRVPDRQDARRVAAPGARPLGAVLSVPRRAGRPPRRLARQPLRRLRAHLALPPEPVCLPGRQARQHAGRRRHRARQLLPDVPLQHVGRPQARQHPAAGGAGRRPGRHAPDRTHAELSRCRRRQPQDVQPVPVDHGSHGDASSTSSATPTRASSGCRAAQRPGAFSARTISAMSSA